MHLFKKSVVISLSALMAASMSVPVMANVPQTKQVMAASSTAASKTAVKKAVRTYKKYLESHKKVKNFALVKISNNGIPALACNGVQYNYDNGGIKYTHITYSDKKSEGINYIENLYTINAKGTAVKNLGSIYPGHQYYTIYYNKGRLAANSLVANHDFSTVQVKNRHLYYTGFISDIFDGEWIHTTYTCYDKNDRNAKRGYSGNIEEESNITESQADALGKKYMKSVLRVHANSKANIKKYVTDKYLK